MKKYFQKYIICLIIFLFIFSCKKENVKEEIRKTSNTVLNNHKYKSTGLPPIRWFECGPQTEPPSQYPCPNASCPYMGWNCSIDVIIIGTQNLQAYNTAAEHLDTYIEAQNTSEFFEEYLDEAVILMPELSDPEREEMLNDLQNGITSVKKHPVYVDEYEQYLNIYQIYVVETGESPNYGDLE